MPLSFMVPIKVLEHHAHLSVNHARILLGNFPDKFLPTSVHTPSFFTGHVISLVGPKDTLHGIKVLGPFRDTTQVEISQSAATQLGFNSVLREEEDIEDSPGAVLVGQAGTQVIPSGVIVPVSHVHLNEADAVRLGITTGERVSALVSGQKKIEVHDILVKIDGKADSELHFNLDEANAAMISGETYAMLKIPEQPCFYDNEGEAVPVPGFSGIRVSLIKMASSPLALEGINLCTNIFEFTSAEKRRMAANLLKVQRGENDNYFFLVAHEGDRVVGVTSTYYLPDVKMAFMEFIAVASDKQRKGLGTFIYHQTLNALSKAGKVLRAMVYEVRATKDDLIKRKDFFLNLGAVPIDLKFYPIGHKMDPELMLMFKPVSADFCLNSSILVKFFSSLSKTLMD